MRDNEKYLLFSIKDDFPFFKKFKKYLLILERERERARSRAGDGWAETEGENPKEALPVSTEPDVVFELTNCEILT